MLYKIFYTNISHVKYLILPCYLLCCISSVLSVLPHAISQQKMPRPHTHASLHNKLKINVPIFFFAKQQTFFSSTFHFLIPFIKMLFFLSSFPFYLPVLTHREASCLHLHSTQFLDNRMRVNTYYTVETNVSKHTSRIFTIKL